MLYLLLPILVSNVNSFILAISHTHFNNYLGMSAMFTNTIHANTLDEIAKLEKNYTHQKDLCRLFGA